MAQGSYVEQDFTRDTNYIGDRILAEPDPAKGPGSDMPVGEQEWPVEAGRYHLVVARACPWANRAIIVRRLLGLEDAISMGVAGPTHDADSWTFDLDEGHLDPVLQIPRIKDAYEARVPGYPRGITVPAVVDIPSGQVVTNDFPWITYDMSGQWREHHREGAPDLWPEELRAEMDEVNKRVYTEVNNGVYRCGFAGTQESYDAAYERLWTAMDWLEERLSTRRYLVGEHITEADVRLFTTLARFDAAYHGHFKCNRSKLTEMPVLWAYARDLFTTPGFGDTTDFVHIKAHYYGVHRDINPTGVVPLGPDLSGWAEPHGRETLGGSPFAPGATAPGPVPERERVPVEHNPHVDPATGLVRTT
ncbi:glutathione S-transferase family protein [Janibacter melonis]|uniref:Glutathione S-transferase family protein n=1 Tax=Janibacter melonis TaxID=262209 RepID=A0A5P8FLB0_9MICO|nr:glutathione S-transferase C-terminal domain-containing protein [Janibacter melonis]QFQ30375.2 glutathione S-transferase family protein [Janibacter melonis]